MRPAARSFKVRPPANTKPGHVHPRTVVAVAVIEPDDAVVLHVVERRHHHGEHDEVHARHHPRGEQQRAQPERCGQQQHLRPVHPEPRPPPLKLPRGEQRHHAQRRGLARPSHQRLRARLDPQPQHPPRHRLRQREGHEGPQQPHVQREAVDAPIHRMHVVVLALVERHHPIVLAHHVPVGPDAGEREEHPEGHPLAYPHRHGEHERPQAEPRQAAQQQKAARGALPTVQVGPRERGEDVGPVQHQHPRPP